MGEGVSAIISDCGLYRYRLDREVDCFGGPSAMLIGVNPSTADATTDDATIRKDIGFAKCLGWSRIIKANLCAYRATDVRELAKCADPIGPDNDYWLSVIMTEADVIVPCWGPAAKLPKHLRQRWRTVTRMAAIVGKPMMCLGTANDGQPRHTLMLAYETPLALWTPPA